MARFLAYGLAVFFLLQYLICPAQEPVTITNPTLELRDSGIHIIYNITGSGSSDLYQIRLELTDSTGGILDAHTFSGDIGGGVPGGEDRVIIWDFRADNIYVEGDLYIQIYALKERKKFSLSSLLLQSLVVPGLGLSRYTGNPHWLKGVAAYACVAGSVVLNRKAISTYEDYLNPGSAENAGSLLEQSGQQDQLSEILAFTALGIWVMDMAWTYVGTRDVSLGAGYDPATKAPLLTLTYRF